MKTNGAVVRERDEWLPFWNPATGEEFGGVAMASREEVEEARRAMRDAAVVWAQKPIRERVRIVKQFQKVLIDSVDEISAVINRDCGKSWQDGLIEVFITVDVIHQYCKNAQRWLKGERVPRGLYVFKRFYTERRPYGTVAVIGPWNYPFLLHVTPVCAALIAGNTVMLKPSEVTAATGVLIERLLGRVPELAPFVRVLHGDGAVGAAVVESKPDLIFLTGSTATGYKVAEAAAKTMTPVLSELGGKDPMIVLEDADLEAAARWGAWGAFYNSGQTCQAVERVYVVESVYDAFLEELMAATDKIKVGYTPDANCPYDAGPLTFQRQVEIVDDHVQEALAKGARVLKGGQRDGMFMKPTILVDVDHDMKIMREETFGPIVPVMKVKDEEEAIRMANDCAYGLSASVWSQDLARAERVAHRIEAGTILVNDAISHYAASQLPKGGVKLSGNARTHGRQDLQQFTQTISYTVSGPPLPIDIATLMRQPGHYRLGKALMQLAFGVGVEQRLEPVVSLLRGSEEEFHLRDAEDTGRSVVEGEAGGASGIWSLVVGGFVAATGMLVLGWWRQRGRG